MQCKSCGSILNTTRILTECPVCGVPFKTETDFNDIVQVLKHIINTYGADTYRNPQLLLSYISDLAPALSDERILLKMCFELNIFELILGAANAAAGEKSLLCLRCSALLQDKRYMRKEMADKAVIWIASSLDWDTDIFNVFKEEPQPAPASQTPAPKPAPQSAPSKQAPQPSPQPAPKPAPKPAQSSSAVNVGDIIEFGSYPQTADGTKKPIEWLVLEKTENQALLISKYALDCRKYNETNAYVTWENCTLRSWLNGEFLNTAFTPSQQAAIALSNVPADKNPEYSTNPGNAVTDKIFLLSIPEAERYFKTNESRKCAPMAYAKAHGARTSDTGLCRWWLRSPGNNQRTAADDYFGSVYYYGGSVNNVSGAVRPALRINLDSFDAFMNNAASQPSSQPTSKPAPQPQNSSFTAANIKVGSFIEFGSYPQTAGGKKKPIEWLVLEKTGNQALIISRYALDAKRYNETYTDITWERCTLRKWLNGEFLNTAFTPAQQAAIALSNVSADGNPKYSKNPGNATKDKIFLLSIPETERYFKSKESRKCAPTAYAKARGAWTNKTGLCWWWLRSPGTYHYGAASVYDDGSVDCYGGSVDRGSDAVRPALRINL